MARSIRSNRAWSTSSTGSPPLPDIRLLGVLWSIVAWPAALAGREPQDRKIAEALEAEGLVGAVWSLTWPDSVRFGAAGRKHAAQETALSTDDRIHVGSVAKTVLATGVLRLVTQGRIQLDHPIEDLLPGVRFDNPWRASDPVLVRHLLDHTAGLNDARLWQVFSRKPVPDTPLARAVGSKPLRIRTRPGSRMSYSNTGYTVLGMLIESVTGERYESWLDREVLGPLGMARSTFAFVTQERDSTLAMGHFEDGVPHPAVPSYLRPAGQFTTTVADMATFSHFLLGDGRIGEAPFVRVDLLRAMGRAVGTEASKAGLEAGYALGLSRRDRHGVIGLCHEGSTIGYRAMLCLFPDEGKSFLVALNADSEGANYGRFDSLLVNALGIARAPAPEPIEGVDLLPWTGHYVPAPGRFQSFAWLDYVMGFATVRDGTQRLRFKPFQGTLRELVPAGTALLRATDRSTASHAMFTTPDGTRVISTGFQTWERVGILPLAASWMSLVAGLLGLAYLLGSGLVKLLRRTLVRGEPAFVPQVAALALLLPLPFFAPLTFLDFGDRTIASALLALVTLTLPLAMAFGLWRVVRGRAVGQRLPALAMAAVLQLTMVLAGWGLIPLVLWRL